MFLVGKRSNDKQMRRMMWESKYYGDIVMGDFMENYYNQSFKIQVNTPVDKIITILRNARRAK